MKIKIPIRFFSLIGMLTLISAAAAEDASTIKKAEMYATLTQSAVGEMMVCGSRISTDYSDIANALDEKFFTFIEGENLQIDVERHYAKMKIYASYYGRNPPDVVEEMCVVNRTLALSHSKSLDEEIRKQRLKRTRTSSKKLNASAPKDCPRAADYYSDRFKESGKISDLTCFQKAVKRELNAAYQ